MANTSVPVARASAGEFRVGRIFDRTMSVYSRNFAKFTAVTLIAALPQVLLGVFGAGDGGGAFGAFFAAQGTTTAALTIVLVVIVTFALYLLSQAVLVYSSFQDMRGKPVDLNQSFNVALVRFPPIVGILLLIIAAILGAVIALSVAAGLLALVGGIAGLIVGYVLMLAVFLMLFVRWFVAIPVCVVERIGPIKCLRRSSQLTSGHRWKIFGIILLLYFVIGIIGQLVVAAIGYLGGAIVGHIMTLIWTAVLMAFAGIFGVVTYYELRSAKEGIDLEQIASVFD